LRAVDNSGPRRDIHNYLDDRRRFAQLLPEPRLTMRTMAQRSSGAFPAAALEWLAPAVTGRVLAVGKPSASVAAASATEPGQIVMVDRSPAAVRAACHRYPSFHGVSAAPDALPFLPCSFAEVVVAQGMHRLAPESTLAEFARVLAPGGRLAVLYTVRNDSVPWVRRLAAILRNFDPSAMSGSPEVTAVAALSSSPHFSRVEHRTFRRWVPITRDGMLEMVSNAPNLVNLPDPDASRLLAGVEALYESSARNPEPLLLPYSVLCWRARVDHSELSGLLRLPAEGLQITL
jgi:SAM-dependent methyltransferase